MFFGYDIAIQALNYHLAFIGCMNHAVLAVVETDILAYLGVAVLVLREEGTEAAPAAQVAPAELGWQSKNILRLLHHGIVNAYLLAGWEEFADYLFLLLGIERIGHFVYDGCELGLEGADGSADGVDVPHEDAGVPIVVASSKVLLGCLQVWLFLESLNLVDFIYGCWF